MRRPIGLALLAIGLLVNTTSHAETPAVQVNPHRTEAGHNFHYVGVKQADDVAIIVNWPSDWVEGDGPIATPYVGAILMMSSGAGERDAATLAADFQDLNAEGDIDDEPEAVRGTLVARPEYLAAAAALGRDILVESHWDERWLQRIQQNLKARKNETHQTLSSESWSTVRRAILGDGRLNDSLTHRPTSLIDDVFLDDIKAWYAQTFTTADTTITAAGPRDLDPAIVGEAIDQLLDGLPSGEGPGESSSTDETITAKTNGKTILLHKPDTEKTLISIGGLMPPARGASHVHDFFAEFVLGAGQQSRLFDAIRTKLRASYVVEADCVIISVADVDRC
ncbi:MAG: insulinase family protein [Geminicoccaceae bacterium]